MAQKIKHWYKKDERFFKTLAYAGNIKSSDANKINISDSRINNFRKDGYIKEISYPSTSHQQIESNRCWILTDKGKTLLKEKYLVNRVQSSHAAIHNCKVAEELCNLSKDEFNTVVPEWDRDLWNEKLNEMSEGDRNRWEEEINQGRLSGIDIIYTTSSGTVTGVEIVTPSYGPEEIQAKEETAELLQIEVQYIST